MAYDPQIERVASVGSILLGILEVQVSKRAPIFLNCQLRNPICSTGIAGSSRTVGWSPDSCALELGAQRTI